MRGWPSGAALPVTRRRPHCRAIWVFCYDVCHAAVEYDDQAGSIKALRADGVPVHKLQLSAALRIPEVTAEARAALAAFDEPTYLHQVVSRSGARLTRTVDLP